MDTITCLSCGAARPSELGGSFDRPPCPQCGGTALKMTASIQESVSAHAQCMAELIPGNQARDWKQRWRQIQKDLESVCAPSIEIMSSESIDAWLQRLCSFYIHAYHLKDALKAAAPSLGLKASTIEEAVSNDPRLALLADLANLDKHSKLTRPLKSGHFPVFGQRSGVDNPTGNGWLLCLKIAHAGATLDGLAVAKDAIDAWREILTVWVPLEMHEAASVGVDSER